MTIERCKDFLIGSVSESCSGQNYDVDWRQSTTGLAKALANQPLDAASVDRAM